MSTRRGEWDKAGDIWRGARVTAGGREGVMLYSTTAHKSAHCESRYFLCLFLHRGLLPGGYALRQGLHRSVMGTLYDGTGFLSRAAGTAIAIETIVPGGRPGAYMSGNFDGRALSRGHSLTRRATIIYRLSNSAAPACAGAGVCSCTEI